MLFSKIKTFKNKIGIKLEQYLNQISINLLKLFSKQTIFAFIATLMNRLLTNTEIKELFRQEEILEEVKKYSLITS